MKRIRWTLAALALGAVLTAGRAQLPSRTPQTSQPLPTTPAAPHRWAVTPQAGKYLVCAATYTGESSAYFAEQVAAYLRGKRMNAYLYNRGEERRKQEEMEYEQRKRMNPDRPIRPHFTRIIPECAVLVGGWNDEAAAQKVANQIRELPAPTVKAANGEEVCDTLILQGEKESQADPTRFQKAGDEKIKLNPLGRSFVIWNPTLPRPQNNASIDPGLKSFNDGNPYSLLKNKKNYTLMVKCYEGTTMFRPSDAPKNEGLWQKLGFGSKSRDALAASAAQAEELAKFLKQSLKYDAWVLHMRQCSLVTVGGFESMEDAEMQTMQQNLSRLTLPGVGPGHQLLPQPVPIQVPKL